MSITTTTHLNFRGDARKALEFYRSVFGGEITAASYGDLGMPKETPGADNLVFGQLTSPAGFRVMAYDVPGQWGGSVEQAGETRRENGTTITDRPFFVSVRGETLEEVRDYWDVLARGATVIEPFTTSPWSPGFGIIDVPERCSCVSAHDLCSFCRPQVGRGRLQHPLGRCPRLWENRSLLLRAPEGKLIEVLTPIDDSGARR